MNSNCALRFFVAEQSSRNPFRLPKSQPFLDGLFLHFRPLLPKVPIRLHCKPHFGSALQERCQAQRHFWAHSTFAPANFVYHCVRRSNSSGELTLRKAQRFQELLFENNSRVDGISNTWSWKFHDSPHSMIITDFDVESLTLAPTKHDSPLFVYADRIKTFPVTSQGLKFVAWWTRKVLELQCRVEQGQLFLRRKVQLLRKAAPRRFCVVALEDVFRGLRLERLYHALSPGCLHVSYSDIDSRCKSSATLRFVMLFGLCGLLSACVSRAPTDCELDRRSGLYPSSYCDTEAAKKAQPAALAAAATSLGTRPAPVPVREQPTVARVWIHDQLLEGGTLMEGTWAFIEVEPSRWAREGQGPLFVPSRAMSAREAPRTQAPSPSRAFNPVNSDSDETPASTRSDKGAL